MGIKNIKNGFGFVGGRRLLVDFANNTGKYFLFSKLDNHPKTNPNMIDKTPWNLVGKHFGNGNRKDDIRKKAGFIVFLRILITE